MEWVGVVGNWIFTSELLQYENVLTVTKFMAEGFKRKQDMITSEVSSENLNSGLMALWHELWAMLVCIFDDLHFLCVILMELTEISKLSFVGSGPKGASERASERKNSNSKALFSKHRSLGSFEPDNYWAIQRSWFARVNALCNLSRKKSREVAAHFRADF